MEKKTNTLAIVALVLLIVNVLALFFAPADTMNIFTYIIIGMIVIAIIQTIVAGVAKKQIRANENEKGMGMAKTCFVLGILAAVFFSISLLGLYMINNDEIRNSAFCPQATDCVDNGDGTSTCKFSSFDIICNNKTEQE